MLKKVREHLIVPIMGRFGTMAATVIAPWVGYPDWRVQFGVGITSVGLIAYDLVIDYAHRRFVADQTYALAVNTMLHGDGK